MKKNKKSLAETHPELAKEAFGWDPTEVVAGTNKKLDWKCSKGHVWNVSGNSRIMYSTGCPTCSNRDVLKGFNDMATTHPHLAKEASGWDPTEVVAGTNKKLEWKCTNGHKWVSSGLSRTFKESNCPVCINQKVLKGFNDMATTHPEIAKEAFDWDPTEVVAGTNKKLDWKCSKGHVWKAGGNKRTQGQGCPICSNKKVLKGFNDMATTHPHLAKEASGWDPTEIIAGTGIILEWKCSKGHTWKVSGSGRVIDETGCSVCSNKKVLKGFNDMATTHPHLAKEASGWDPTEIIAGTGIILEWKCSKGHTWKVSGSGRVSQNSGCPTCINHKLLRGFNDLATTHPHLASEAFGWDPTEVISGTGKVLEWQCSKGHIWETSGYIRTVVNSGCPICSNRKLLKGSNDLATTHPHLASEAFGWDPTEIVAGTSERLEWKCLKGHTWKATGNARSAGRGCPSCAQTGYDPNQNGYLYFLIQPIWEMYQIGITNFPESRLQRHRKNGFELLELRGPMDGHTAQELETNLLRYLKNQNAELSPEHIAGRFDGYTESWTIDSYKVNDLKELIDKAREAGY